MDAFLAGRRSTSTAETNNETPARAIPLWIPPVPLASAPMAIGPANPPKFPTELIKAMPEAAENPTRNSLGNEKNGPKKL